MKKLMSLLLAMVLCMGLCVPAFATEPVQEAIASEEAALYNETIYRQELLSVMPVMEDGVQVGTVSQYRFTPLVQPRGPMNQVVYMAEYKSAADTYARLYGYFMYDGVTVDCYDSSVVFTSDGFTETDRTSTHNASETKVTLKLYFLLKSLSPVKKTLSLWCDRDGNHG